MSDLDPRQAAALVTVSNLRGWLDRYERVLRQSGVNLRHNVDGPLRNLRIAETYIAQAWRYLAAVPEVPPEPPPAPSVNTPTAPDLVTDEGALLMRRVRSAS